MAYVPVPKDLTKVKSKFAFNLTKRQILCFGLAAAIGLPLFFLLKGATGTTVAAFAMILVMLPCFLFAMYEKNGQPLEVYLNQFIQANFVRPKYRPYETDNHYAAILRHMEAQKEVERIVRISKERQGCGTGVAGASDKGREKTDTGSRS